VTERPLQNPLPLFSNLSPSAEIWLLFLVGFTVNASVAWVGTGILAGLLGPGNVLFEVGWVVLISPGGIIAKFAVLSSSTH
jgi:hypothetical protein